MRIGLLGDLEVLGDDGSIVVVTGAKQRALLALLAMHAGRGVPVDQLVALDEALSRLALIDPIAGKMVEIRYFSGQSVKEIGADLGISTATAYRHWEYARVWLRCELLDDY